MKKLTLLIAIATVAALAVTSCDYVIDPDQVVLSGGGGGAGDTLAFDSVRKVLVEDYTGHKCPNCPAAATTANSILAANSGTVVVVGVHAGFFANPMASGTQFLRDFRTTAGTAYDTYFGISAVGNPNGMVNRKDYTPSTITHIKSHTSWPTEVATELAKPATAAVEIKNTYNSASRGVTCNVSSLFFYDTLSGGPYKLIVMLIQDSIISDQQNGSTYLPVYTHQHMLRGNLNGTWGDTLAVSGAITAGSLISKTYTYTLPATFPAAGGASSSPCDENQCYIVAFIYNDLTKEVIDVEEEKIIP